MYTLYIGGPNQSMYVCQKPFHKYSFNLIVKSLFHDGCTRFQGISQTQMKKLLKWNCQSTSFQFNGKFYKQIDGVVRPFLLCLLT